eukprot:2086634-Rhodomonas_salina.3
MGDLLEYNIASGAWYRDLSWPPVGAPPWLLPKWDANSWPCVAAHDGKLLVLGAAGTIQASLTVCPRCSLPLSLCTHAPMSDVGCSLLKHCG